MGSKGLIEFIFGDPWGLLILFVNLMEATALVGGFFAIEKIGEGETKLGWAIAGGFGNFFQAPFFWVINQRWYLHWTLWVLAFIFAFISGILIVGILGRSVKNYLIKACVPTTFYLIKIKYNQYFLPGSEPIITDNNFAFKFKNFSFIYGSDKDESPAIKNVSFSLKKGKILVLAGPSGSGKSTL
ncbi:MAG: ATP-binding cassette domain-containing protein, partial [Candidatus Lokiarchaeota archaeon]|nr:ATP-binding cassette domain-containing protein [Candidatus Lokiarchaeota archaeon]